MLNYSKKLDKRIFIPILIICAVFLLANTMQTGFAANVNVDNSTAGGGILQGLDDCIGPDNTINLADGNYTGTNNTGITINKNVTIKGSSADNVIIDAEKARRIFIINNNLNVTFINITFINGYSSAGGSIFGASGSIISLINCNFNQSSSQLNGGAIYIESSYLSIQNSNFINNTAEEIGGGVSIRAANIVVSIFNSSFINNTANNSNGGALYLTSLGNNNVTIVNSSFIGNTARNGGGLGIFSISNVNNTNFTIFNSSFMNNTVSNGGGGFLLSCGLNSTYNAVIINSSIVDNTANDGGGIIISNFNNSISNVVIVNSSIVDNTARNGGGIYVSALNESNTTVNIIDSNISKNSAVSYGGAIFAIAYGNSIVNINNSTLNDNSAGGNGGAIFSSTGENLTGNSTVIVSGSDLSGNSAGSDGGAVSSSTGDGSSGDSTVIIDDSTINDNNAGNNGGALSSNTGENSTGNSAIIVIDSDIENNTASNNGDTASATTGDGSSGDSEIDIIGDSTIINNNPDKDDDGIYTSTGEDSTGSSEINIDDGVIKKLSSNSTIIVSNTVIGKTFVIRGVAIDENGNPLANIQLTINIDGVDYNVTTNALGEWSLNYTPSSPGIITVTVDLNENNKYYAFTNTTDFNVAKANTRSTIIISNATSGKSTIIRGVLIDENGNTIANAPINVVIGGKSHNLVTGADGSWSLSYTPAKAGKFIAKVYYNGNINNLASTSSLNYTVAQGTSAPKKTDIRLLKKKSSKVFRHGKRVVMKWFTYKNYGATGSKNITTKVIIKNLKYKLWKVYNKKLSYKYGNNKIKFKLNLKSGEKFKLKLKVYKPIK